MRSLPPHRRVQRGLALAQQVWTTVRRWRWVLLLTLASLGVLLALISGDHRLASRSTAVMVGSIVLWSLQEMLAEPLR